MLHNEKVNNEQIKREHETLEENNLEQQSFRSMLTMSDMKIIMLTARIDWITRGQFIK